MSADLWQRGCERLATVLPEQQFNTWIKPLSAQVAEDLSRVTVMVGNRFKLDWIRAQYAGRITALLESLYGQPIHLELALAPRESALRTNSSAISSDIVVLANAQASSAEEAATGGFKNRLNTATPWWRAPPTGWPVPPPCTSQDRLGNFTTRFSSMAESVWAKPI